MPPPTYAASLTADERLGEVASILAVGILRARLRDLRSPRTAPQAREYSLELSARTSAHALETSRDREE